MAMKGKLKGKLNDRRGGRIGVRWKKGCPLSGGTQNHQVENAKKKKSHGETNSLSQCSRMST